MLQSSFYPDLETMLVVASQNFIRDPANFGEDCSVSLRDVRRYKKLVQFFRKMREARSKADDEEDERKAALRSDTAQNSILRLNARIPSPRMTSLLWRLLSFMTMSFGYLTAVLLCSVLDFHALHRHGMFRVVTRAFGQQQDVRRHTRYGAKINGRREEEIAIVLSLAMCYHSRLPTSEARYNYRLCIKNVWNQHRRTAGVGELNDDQFLQLLETEQKDILERMLMKAQEDGTRQLRKDWEGTAMNGALLENVFVLMICILNRIPVFLVGKPGSSKSLSMKLIYRYFCDACISCAHSRFIYDCHVRTAAVTSGVVILTILTSEFCPRCSSCVTRAARTQQVRASFRCLSGRSGMRRRTRRQSPLY